MSGSVPTMSGRFRPRMILASGSHCGIALSRPFRRTHRIACSLGVDGLTTSPSGYWSMPGQYRILDQPNGKAASSYQRSLVCRPVRHPVSGRRDLMAAPFVEPVVRRALVIELVIRPGVNIDTLAALSIVMAGHDPAIRAGVYH